MILSAAAMGEEGRGLSVKRIDSVSEYDDVRFKIMTGLDLSKRKGLPETLSYNERTTWPDASRLPAGFDPKTVMENAKNPGLGVRALHKRGITGKGVNLAIIDQPLYLDHPEYAGKIAAYVTYCGFSVSSMHGPAVASLLVGADCGTAPDARVYYAATPSWTADAKYEAKALDWVIAENDKLPSDRKIRAVSISSAPSGPGSPFKKNTDMWDAACARAEKAGILIVDCEQTRGFVGPCRYDAGDSEAVAKCTPGIRGSQQCRVARCRPGPHVRQDNRRRIRQGAGKLRVLR